jgi:hypothetical protein
MGTAMRPRGDRAGYSEDTTADNVSLPQPRTCRAYSDDTQIRAGDNGGPTRLDRLSELRRINARSAAHHQNVVMSRVSTALEF